MKAITAPLFFDRSDLGGLGFLFCPIAAVADVAHKAIASIQHKHPPASARTPGAHRMAGARIAPVAAKRHKLTLGQRVTFAGQPFTQEEQP